MSTAAQLASVRAAIAAIESGGQSVGAGGRALTRADLGKLYDRERELIARLASETAATAAATSGRSAGRNRMTYVVPD